MTTNESKITITETGQLIVPDKPIIPFIEGDGTGPDIWRATRLVLDAAVARAYGGARAINAKQVPYDLARQMEGSTEVGCSRFAEIAIEHMPG